MGIRTQKVAGSVTNYTLVDNRVTAQKTGGAWTYYRYDEQGSLLSLNWQGNEYFYVRNVQGDIIGLVDEAGNLVVEYAYDAWGKQISCTGNLAATLGTANPFRYRGYYYDTETGLYYLQSRYYNPAICRFISKDDPSYCNGVDGLNANLYVYCLNNPVMNIDSSGCSKNRPITVTLCVVSPNPGSTVCFKYKNKEFTAGHAYLMLDPGTDPVLKESQYKIISRGFAPATTSPMTMILTKSWGPGKIKDDSKQHPTSTLTYIIDRSQYKKIYQSLYVKNAPEYHIAYYNCATFAIDTLNKANVRHGFKPKKWNIGIVGGLLDFADFFNLGGSVTSTINNYVNITGYNPAQLAVDIDKLKKSLFLEGNDGVMFV